MNEIVQRATTELIVDGELAKKELDIIDEKIKDVNKQLQAARKSGDEQLKKSLTAQKNQLIANKKSLQKEAIEVNRILNNLSTAKPKELNETIRTLTRQLSDPNIKRKSPEWKYLTDQIQRCRQELRQVNSELSLSQSRLEKATGFVNKYAGIVATAVAAITGISLAFSQLRKKRDELEESKADLKALTGLDDDSITWLTNQARTLSTKVTEDGIRIRQSTSEIVEAFKLVGSAKPELLGNKEALAEVTEQTLILSVASGMKLTDAVDATTLALNQYGHGADQAARYVNALAAGSKYGAVAVESQTKAIVKSGVAASSAGIPIEQLVGTIETLGEKGIKDEIAGTGLKKFFLTLQTGADSTNPKVVGLTTALDNLQKQQLSAAEIKAKFGEEGYNVASVLINEAQKVEYYTKAVTGTSVAIEQATVISQTAAAKRAQAKNELNEIGIQLLEKLNPALLGAINLTTSWTRHFVSLVSWISKNCIEIGICTGAIILYTAAVNKSVLQDKAKAFWTDKVTTKLKALFITLKAHPWVALTAVVVSAGVALYKFLTYTSDAEKAVKDFNKELSKEQLEAGLLFDTLKKTNEGTETRKNLIQTINEKYGQFLSNQLTEKSNYEDINKALKEVNSSLETQIAMKMKNEAGSSITEDYINDVADKYDYIRKEVTGQSSEEIARLYVSDLKTLIQEGEKSAFEVYAELKKRYGNVLTASGHRDLDRIKKRADEYKKDLADLDGKFAFINTPTPVTSPSGEGGSGNDGKGRTGNNGEGGTEAKEKKSLLKIQQDLREEAEKMDETTEEELALKNRKLQLIDAEIVRLKELGVVKKTEKKQKTNKEKEDKEKQEALKANANMYSALKAQVKQQYLDQEISEAVYNRRIELLDMKSTAERIKILQKYKEDASSEEEQLLDKRIAMAKKVQEVGKLSNYLGVPEEEEEDPELANLIERTKKTYTYKQAALKNEYEKGLITQKEYQDQERELLEEHLTEMLSSRMNFANQANQIASQATQLVTTLSQREEIAVENKYAAQLKAAKGNAEKTAALNEQMEEEKKAVKKKYADIDFAITAAQIIANTAAGVMQIWATTPFPANIALATIVGATGIAQLLLANEQRQQVKNLWTGGFTPSGRWDEPKGIVHSEEFVGNRFAVRNKAVNRVFRMIDVAQKNNTIATINETDIIRALGGRLSPDPQKEVTYQDAPSGTDPHITEALLLLSSTVSDLKKQMQDGTLARTYVTGDGGTKTARDKFDKMLKNVTRYNKK